MHSRAYLPIAYRADREQLVAERLPQAVGVFLCGAAGLGVIECTVHPSALPSFLVAYAVAVVATSALVLLRRGLARRRLAVRACVATAALLAALPQMQQLWVRCLPPEGIVMLGLCFLTLGAVVIPWGAWGQGLVALAFVGAATAAAAADDAPSAALGPLLAAALAAGVSVLIAYEMELHRFAIFREATRADDEAAVSRTLVAIAREINAVLDPRGVLDRIAASTKGTVGCDWSMILLRDEQAGAFRVAAGIGQDPETFAEVSGLDFDVQTFPLLGRILDEHYVEIPNRAVADPVSAGFLARWHTQRLLATTLVRSGKAIGILAAGARHARPAASAPTRQLFRGIAQHAGIALNNVRLVDELRHADRLKSEFVAAMSHELRTPLNVIMGYTDLLVDDTFGPLAAEQRETMGRIRDAACGLLELVNETLDVNRLEAGRAAVQLREVELAALFGDLQREVEQLPRKPHVAVRWEVQVGNACVHSDPMKLKIIVKNLVSNALKFTDAGSVRIGARYTAGRLDLNVSDSGSGIAAEDLPHIFDMFRQGGNGADRGGVGLGLYILRRFVEQLDGTVQVASVPGHGTTFTVGLAAPTAAGSAAGPRPARADRRARTQLRNVTGTVSAAG